MELVQNSVVCRCVSIAADRSGVEVAEGVTAQACRGLNQLVVHRGNRATRTTAEVRLDVGGGNRCSTGFALFKSVLLFGTVDLTEVVDAGIGLRILARFDEVGDRDCRQEADDGHDDHDFHQREARLIRSDNFHYNLSAFLNCGVNEATGGLIIVGLRSRDCLLQTARGEKHRRCHGASLHEGSAVSTQKGLFGTTPQKVVSEFWRLWLGLGQEPNPKVTND